jgi:hypothetical protein
LIFRITRIGDDLARDHVNRVAGHARLHRFTRFFDGGADGDESALDFERGFGFSFTQTRNATRWISEQ